MNTSSRTSSLITPPPVSGASLQLDSSRPIRRPRKTHKLRPSGFTMIELIGAMIIIAILTVAGITAVSTAINNSRITAVNEDLNGFRKVAEQFLMENPDVSKWNGVNSPQQTRESFNLFNDKYLEGEMKIDPSTQQTNGDIYARGKTKRLDPYGNPYVILLSDQKLQTDGTNANSYLCIYIRCDGKNGTNADYYNYWFNSPDSDDIISITQFAHGQVASMQFSSEEISSYYNWGYSYMEKKWRYIPTATIPGRRAYG